MSTKRSVRRRPRRLASVPDILGPGEVPVQVTINGTPHSATLEPCATLLDAMREVWGLTGAKRVCDRGTCGACTVLLDGKRVYACSLLAIDVQDHAITTIESLDTNGSLDPVQQAFVDNDALQCGFCTAGFVMSCKGYLIENPDPAPDEIDRGLGGNICRCGTYIGIRAAVLQAAAALKKLQSPRGKKKVATVATRRARRHGKL
jgi:aerobic-type carbon monoxide dehydrogenase small subunit (CoxS/CutS family)